jgi:uncharacterized membrane protein YesL
MPKDVIQRIDKGAALIISNDFLRNVLSYHFTLFIVFVMMYRYMIPFEDHFDLKYKAPSSMSTVAYYVLHTQSTVMCEIVPKTALGRSLQATHIFLSWFIIILSMAPIN